MQRDSHKKRFSAVFSVSKLCYEKIRFYKRVEKRFFKRALNIATHNRMLLCLWAFLVKGFFGQVFPNDLNVSPKCTYSFCLP